MGGPISSDLERLLGTGVSLIAGTRDARLVPECARAVGVRVEEGGGELTAFLPAATSARMAANLRDNGRFALCACRIEDHFTIQFKGRLVSLAEAQERDRDLVDRYRGLFAHTVGIYGLPPRLTLRIGHWPCLAVRFRVESVFVQTPGPGAGAPLVARNGGPAR